MHAALLLFVFDFCLTYWICCCYWLFWKL